MGCNKNRKNPKLNIYLRRINALRGTSTDQERLDYFEEFIKEAKENWCVKKARMTEAVRLELNRLLNEFPKAKKKLNKRKR